MDRPRRSTRAPIKAPQLVVPLQTSKTEPQVSVDDGGTVIATQPAKLYKRKFSSDAEHKAKSTATGPPIDQDKMFKTLMQSSKSDFVTMDMNDIINANTWTVLSEEAKSHLKTLLPATAFADWHESLGDDHPCLEGLNVNADRKTEGVELKAEAGHVDNEEENAMVVDEERTPQCIASTSVPIPVLESVTQMEPHPPREVTQSFFSDSHFQAALRTFQDQLYLNYFSDTHMQKVTAFRDGILAGKLAAPWKDEVWERDNPVAIPAQAEHVPAGVGLGTLSSALAGGASQVKLNILAKDKVIRVGDVIAYKRSFSMLDIMVEKDAIIQSIDRKTHAITILTQRGTTKDLPKSLLSSLSSSSMDVDTEGSSQPPILSLTINSPTMLETALLDIDARVDKARRPNGNAWKAFNIYRYRTGADYNPYDSRGGRELHGALFYLRAEYYSENY